MKILSVLQNAWSPLYAGGIWPRESWLKALWRCRSGQRLKYLVDNCDTEIWFDNTTPIVGESPNSIVPADIEYILSLLNNIKPTTIITFGKLAEKAVLSLKTEIKCLFLPHPACRIVTNDCYLNAAKLINQGFNESMKLDTKGRGVAV